ncbi:NDP-sugar synthase [Candidatus Bathyarchaeota archaeon]|nr:MAG: NDP-sugar synthase [Candidatus Bathyarchaeota archaeon]
MLRIHLRGLILAGGFATRLRPLSCSKPKLLFPIVGMPLVESMARWLSSGGINQIILAVNHLSDKLKIEVGHHVAGVPVKFSVEETPLGTAGPIRLAANLLGRDDPFFVANGDIVSDIEIRHMLAVHEETNAEATIALVSVPDPSPYGSVLTDPNGKVKKFEEKSAVLSATSHVNAGVYVLSPGVIDSIPGGRSVSLEKEVFPKLVRNGRMQSWMHKGFWYDIGRVSEYVRANHELLEKQELKAAKPVASEDGGEILRPSYLGTRTHIGVGAKVGPLAILSDNVSVGDEAIVRNSIIFEETSIGEKATVEGSIIGERVVIGKRSRIGNGSIIAGQLTLPEGSILSPNSLILC